jgi:cyanophycinase
MPGLVALVGAGEFLDSMRPVDEQLLAACGGQRVAVLPTASAPDGPGVPERWAELGRTHFSALGARVQPVMALTREDCQQADLAGAVASSNLVYFSGGKPDYLFETLQGTALWRAVEGVLASGGVLAGCSAGAMVMGGFVPSMGSKLGLPWVGGWQAAFGLLPHSVVIPHYNEMPETIMRLFFRRRPKQAYILGVDANTALVGSTTDWHVAGSGRVTLISDGKTERYLAGQQVPVPVVQATARNQTLVR